MKNYKNVIETLVEEKVDEVLPRFNCCQCELCRNDVVALALNNLPPKYVASHIGSLYAKLSSISTQYGADVLTAVSNAIEIVKNNPRH